MGDTRFERSYERVREAADRAEAIRSLQGEDLVAALAAASRHRDGYLANVLATEAQNRIVETTSMLENMGDGVYVISEQGVVVAANPQVARSLGRLTAEIVGHDMHALSECVRDDAPDRARGSCPVIAAMRSGRAQQCDARYRRSDGRDVLVAVTATPIQRDGDPYRAVVVMHDVTLRRQTEEVAQRLAAIFESSEDAIIVRTPEGIINDWNPAATRIFGHSKDEAIGRQFDLLIPTSPRGEELRLRQRVLAGERIEHQRVKAFRKDGAVLELSVTHSPVRNKARDVIAVACILRDVTRQRSVERRLRLLSLLAGALVGAAGAALALTRETPGRRRAAATSSVSFAAEVDGSRPPRSTRPIWLRAGGTRRARRRSRPRAPR